MDRIELWGMEFFGCHGIFIKERQKGQKFIVDLFLYMDLKKAGNTDNLAHSIDYTTVFDDVRKIVEGAAKNIIESIAEEIAKTLLKKYALARVEVAVHKPHAPIAGTFRDVCVRIQRDRP